MKNPCKDCKERAVACHGSCKLYAEWRAKLESYKAIERADQDLELYNRRRRMENLRGRH